MKALIFLPIILLVAGCNTTHFKATKPDGTSVEITNQRWMWSTESYSARLTGSGASLTASKSNVDAEAIAAAVEAALSAKH